MSSGTFMYDELIEFQLEHSPFVGDPPQAPSRDYKIIFERDWNHADFLGSCKMPFVKDSANNKDLEQDTGQSIYDWHLPVGESLLETIDHEDAASQQTLALSYHTNHGGPRSQQSVETFVVFPRYDDTQQWRKGSNVTRC